MDVRRILLIVVACLSGYATAKIFPGVFSPLVGGAVACVLCVIIQLIWRPRQ